MNAETKLLRQQTACPRCGQIVTWSGHGRPPTWCSDACRYAAYRERKAAQSGAVGVQVRVVERLVEPSWDEMVAKVMASPTATRRVLRMVRRQLREDAWAPAHWAGVRQEAHGLGLDMIPRLGLSALRDMVIRNEEQHQQERERRCPHGC